MIVSQITDRSISFVGRGRLWTLGEDHPYFDDVRDRLLAKTEDVDALIRMTDVTVAVQDATKGRAVLSEEGISFDGKQLDGKWAEKAAANPEIVRVLVVNPGDRVRIEGDPDAPDGVYVVGATDDGDADSRIYVESEDDFFGYVENASIKEILEAA